MNRMFRPVVPLVLVAIIGASPMVRELCRIACDGVPSGAASHAHHADPATPDHAMAGHHGAGPEPSATGSTRHAHPEGGPAATQDHSREGCWSPALGSRRHCSDGADAHVASIAATKQAVDPPAVTPQIIASASRSQASSRTDVETSARPPVPLALRTPLRL
jgi:hypothetical protein